MPAGAALSPDSLLREMSHLWLTLGQRGQIESGEGVLRACSLTLLVLTDENENSQALGETLAALMPQHPARTIIIRLQAAGNPEPTGRAFSQCWMPFGKRRQICCEQIEISAPETGLADALAVVDALTAPDLPAVAWCRDLRLLDRPEFDQLAAISTRIIVDSAAAPDPRAILVRLADRAARGIRIGDLSWTRLTRWRQMISQFFDNPGRRARVRGLVQVAVQSAETTESRYLAAWLADGLSSLGGSVRVAFEPVSAGDLHRVVMRAENLSVALRGSGGRLILEGDGLSHCVSLPPCTAYSLMREELDVAGADPVFTQTLASAAKDL